VRLIFEGLQITKANYQPIRDREVQLRGGYAHLHADDELPGAVDYFDRAFCSSRRR